MFFTPTTRKTTKHSSHNSPIFYLILILTHPTHSPNFPFLFLFSRVSFLLRLTLISFRLHIFLTLSICYTRPASPRPPPLPFSPTFSSLPRLTMTPHSLTHLQYHINYLLNRSRRARHIRLSIDHRGLILTLPQHVPHLIGRQYLKKNLPWIKKTLLQHPAQPLNKLTPRQLTHLKIKTRNLVRLRIDHFNHHYGFTFRRITIRNQKTRWGSCSLAKTLSFNLRLALLPTTLSDYIIVHELCHLKQMNHGPKFWALVAQTLPHHKSLRRQLKSYPLHLQ